MLAKSARTFCFIHTLSYGNSKVMQGDVLLTDLTRTRINDTLQHVTVLTAIDKSK